MRRNQIDLFWPSIPVQSIQHWRRFNNTCSYSASLRGAINTISLCCQLNTVVGNKSPWQWTDSVFVWTCILLTSTSPLVVAVTTAGTHFAYPRKDDEARLAWVTCNAVYPRTVIHHSTTNPAWHTEILLIHPMMLSQNLGQAETFDIINTTESSLDVPSVSSTTSPYQHIMLDLISISFCSTYTNYPS